MGSAAVHRSFVVVDVEGYGDLARTTHHRLTLREGMYRVLRDAFAECDLPWREEDVDDAGDSLLVVLPPQVPKIRLADHLPTRVAAELRRHNAGHATGARIRLRMVLHAGELTYDGHGKTGPELIAAFRLLDAASAKQALRDSTATLVVIASDTFYDGVIRQDPAAHPDDYADVAVAVKEFRARAWVRLVDGRPVAPARRPAGTARPLPLSRLGPIVEVLLRTPGFDTRAGRDLVLRDVPFAGSIPRHSADRADTASIVQTCTHYPGGLKTLVEAVGFYATGTGEVVELEALLADLGDDA